MDVAEAFARFVANAHAEDPQDIVAGLEPFERVSSGQGSWIRFNLGLAYFKLRLWEKFDAVSDAFCFSEATGTSDFRVARIRMLNLRIEYLKETGRAFGREATALLRMSPTSHDLAVLRDTPFADAAWCDFVFEPDTVWRPPAIDVPADWRPCAVGEYHPSTEPPDPVAPTVEGADDVECLFAQDDFSAWRGDRVYSALSSMTSLVDLRRSMQDRGDEPTRRPGTALILSDLFQGSNYCHWTYDWFPRLLLAQFAGERIDFVYVRGLDGLVPRTVLEQHCATHEIGIIEAADRQWFRFDRVLTVDNQDIASTHPCWRGHPLPVDLLRRHFRVDDSNGPGKRRVYITRRDAPTRRVLNEEAIANILYRYDFEIVQLTGMTADQQVRLFSDCSCCVAPHGAGLTNIVFMPRESSVLELFHWGCGTSGYVPVARTLRHRYFYLTCGSSSAARSPDEPVSSVRSAMHHDSPIWVDEGALAAWAREQFE